MVDGSSFVSYLTSLLHQYNDHPTSDPVQAAQAELKGVKDIMQANIEQVLNRGERLELLVDRTDQAANQSLQFRRRAVGLRRQMWWKNVKVMALAGFCLLVSLREGGLKRGVRMVVDWNCFDRSFWLSFGQACQTEQQRC